MNVVAGARPASPLALFRPFPPPPYSSLHSCLDYLVLP